MVDLFRLFDTFCRSWMSTPAFLRAGQGSATIIAFPEPAPKTERLVEPVDTSGELVTASASKSRAA